MVRGPLANRCASARSMIFGLAADCARSREVASSVENYTSRAKHDFRPRGAARGLRGLPHRVELRRAPVTAHLEKFANAGVISLLFAGGWAWTGNWAKRFCFEGRRLKYTHRASAQQRQSDCRSRRTVHVGEQRGHCRLRRFIELVSVSRHSAPDRPKRRPVTPKAGPARGATRDHPPNRTPLLCLQLRARGTHRTGSSDVPVGRWRKFSARSYCFGLVMITPPSITLPLFLYSSYSSTMPPG